MTSDLGLNILRDKVIREKKELADMEERDKLEEELKDINQRKREIANKKGILQPVKKGFKIDWDFDKYKREDF